MTTVSNDTELRAKHPEGPMTLVLDNARYQKCELVFEKAGRLGVELLYLPPYSPNLNTIERPWKHVKQACLKNTYSEDFASFRGAIGGQIDNGQHHAAR